MFGLDKDQINFINELIQDIYSTELIFQDFKDAELNINWDDEKFIIPYKNFLQEKKELLLSISNNKIYDRIIAIINKQIKNTLLGMQIDLNKMYMFACKQISTTI